jgi:hypothetical protein
MFTVLVTVQGLYVFLRDQVGSDPTNSTFQWLHDHVGFAAVTA